MQTSGESIENVHEYGVKKKRKKDDIIWKETFLCLFYLRID
jgi:hypothetical protein